MGQTSSWAGSPEQEGQNTLLGTEPGLGGPQSPGCPALQGPPSASLCAMWLSLQTLLGLGGPIRSNKLWPVVGLGL